MSIFYRTIHPSPQERARQFLEMKLPLAEPLALVNGATLTSENTQKDLLRYLIDIENAMHLKATSERVESGQEAECLRLSHMAAAMHYLPKEHPIKAYVRMTGESHLKPAALSHFLSTLEKLAGGGSLSRADKQKLSKGYDRLIFLTQKLDREREDLTSISADSLHADARELMAAAKATTPSHSFLDFEIEVGTQKEKKLDADLDLDEQIATDKLMREKRGLKTSVETLLPQAEALVRALGIGSAFTR
jgi:hypothetical protein